MELTKGQKEWYKKKKEEKKDDIDREYPSVDFEKINKLPYTIKPFGMREINRFIK